MKAITVILWYRRTGQNMIMKRFFTSEYSNLFYPVLVLLDILYNHLLLITSKQVISVSECSLYSQTSSTVQAAVTIFLEYNKKIAVATKT